MANKTTNYNLTKPLASEFYDVSDQNGNMDIIDTELKKNADEIAGVKAGAMTSAERQKLAGIEAGANKYVHPSTHPASMIVETESVKMMTAGERSKLAGIEQGANKYTHPSTHPASMITGLPTGFFEQISKTVLSAASAAVSIPLPSGYTRYRLTCYNYNGGKANNRKAYIDFFSSGSQQTPDSFGNISVKNGGAPASDSSISRITIYSDSASVLKTVLDIYVYGTATDIHSISSATVSNGSYATKSIEFTVTASRYSTVVDEARMSSSGTFAVGAAFILEGVKG